MECSLREQRERDIMQLYFATLRDVHAANGDASRSDVMATLAQAPAPRFYVSFEIARRMVSCMERGMPVNMHNRKIDMYREIYRRYSLYKERTCCTGYQCLYEILASQAPSFYITAITMQGIVYRSMRKKTCTRNT